MTPARDAKQWKIDKFPNIWKKMKNHENHENYENPQESLIFKKNTCSENHRF